MPWDLILYIGTKAVPGQFLYAGTEKVPLFSLGIIGRKQYVEYHLMQCFSLIG